MQRSGSTERARDVGLAVEIVDAEAATPPAPPLAARPLARVVLAASLVLVSLNLRPVFSSLAALMPEVRQATGASPAIASLLTTTPVLCLGLFAATAPSLARRFGAEHVIFVLLLTLAAGTALRGFGTVPALLAGSVIAGASIAVVNVLLPGLVKRDFPDRVAAMTGLYSMALSAGAAFAAALTVPMERRLGGSWAGALAAWGVPALAAAILWVPQALRSAPGGHAAAQPRPSLWRDPLAWQVTFFMGLQSALAYCIFGWLAPLLRARGLDPATAGYVVFLSVMVQTVSCLASPSLATRGRDQRPVSLALAAFAVAGFLGCLFAPLSTVWVWAALQGLGQGGLIAVALTVIVLRAPDALTAARLSSMAQSVGYVLAAFGPLVMGLIFTATGNPQATAVPIVLLGAGVALAAWGAGQDRLLRP